MIDNTLSRRIIIYAAVSGGLGVLIGTFGAHGLESFLSNRGYDSELIAKRVDQFDVGVQYHLIHAIALLALAGLPYGSPVIRRWVARSFLVGLILFCGSLYLLVLTNASWLGMITPIGGLCWYVGWLMLLLLARPWGLGQA